MPDALQVSILAALQGLTEFLPISSSGHLVIFGSLLDLPEGGLLLPVALHLGTLLAVLVVYRDTLRRTLLDLIGGRPRYALLILLGSVPAGLAGVLLEDWFEARFHDPRAAAFGLFGTAVVLVVAETARRRRRAALRAGEALRPADALWIGLAQAVAILPGVSRSGSTIGVGLLRGLHPAEAARFSFVLSVVAIGGAALLEARKLLDGEDPNAPGVLLVAWGVLLSAIVGWASLRLLLAFLSRGAFVWFALYCVLLGGAFLLLT